ncbi:MAG: leucine-rich repeat domain-containing protein [Limisphaerales bacterium]
MKPKRNLIQFCLLGALLLALPAVVQAQFTYTTNADDTLTITGYTGSNGVVTIPGTIADLPVTSIGDWAFYATSVTNVLIPDNVTNIGDGAFFDCQSLTNVTIGNSVVSIGDWTFAFCPSLMSVCCRGDAPSLGGGNVFYGNLATVYYLSGATNWEPTFDGHPAVLWNPPVPFTYTTNSDGITLTITGYTGSGGAVTIPDSINFLPVEIIGDDAFENCFSLTGITIPDTVTSILNNAFTSCIFLTSAVIPSSVTNIEYDAFENCINLSNVAIPNSVTSMGTAVFWGCYSLSSISIPNGIYNFGDYAFYECGSLTNVAISINATNIGDSAFYGCERLVGITIPDGLASIGNNAFGDCISLTSITIPSSVTSLGGGVFNGCTHLASVTIPDSITSLGDAVFVGCSSLTNVTIPSSVTSIGDYMFRGCSSLTSIIIPSSISNVGDYVFWQCNNLTGCYFLGNAPGLNSISGVSFYENTNVTVYYLPGTTGWDEFALLTGVPTALWSPAMQTSDGSFGVRNNQFGFNINWASDQTVVVEACTNLANPGWVPVGTNTLTDGSSYFSDPQWTNYPGRFYRLRSP